MLKRPVARSPTGVATRILSGIRSLRRSRAQPRSIGPKGVPKEDRHAGKETGSASPASSDTRTKNRHGTEHLYFFCLANYRRRTVSHQKAISVELVEAHIEDKWAHVQFEPKYADLLRELSEAEMEVSRLDNKKDWCHGWEASRGAQRGVREAPSGSLRRCGTSGFTEEGAKEDRRRVAGRRAQARHRQCELRRHQRSA
jgi:hypothetical protein